MYCLTTAVTGFIGKAAEQGNAQAIEILKILRAELRSAQSALQVLTRCRKLSGARPVQPSAGVQLGDQLADAIDQNVLIVDRGQPEDARRDRDFHASVFVSPTLRSGLVASEKIGCSIDPISSLGIASVTSQMKKPWIG